MKKNTTLSQQNRRQDAKQLRILSGKRKPSAVANNPADKAAKQLEKLLKTHKLSDLVFDDSTGRYRLKTAAVPAPRYVKGVRNSTVPLDTYQVFRDVHGIVYLRVGHTKKGAEFIVNKGWSVELVELDAYSTNGGNLALRAVPQASITYTARQLLHPLNQQITISVKAREVLEKILQNKELKMKATESTAKPVKPAKFATVTAPPAKGSKVPAKVAAAIPAAKEKAKPAKASNKGEGTRNSIAGKRIRVISKKHTARPGTKRAPGLGIILASKTVDEAVPKLEKAGCDRTWFSFAVKEGLIALV